MPKKSIIFMGSTQFSLPTLETLYQHHDVLAVYTKAPKPAHRGMQLQYTPVQQFAMDHGIPVHIPKTLRNAQEVETLKAYQADFVIVAAYGLILPKNILDIPCHGCLNVHGSLLPRWRGAAPLQRALMAGDTTTGITIMQMDEGLDTGDMLLQEALTIEPEDNLHSLHDKMKVLGAKLMLQTLATYETLVPQKQDDTHATYAHKLEKSEYVLSYDQPGATLMHKIRALSPKPGARLEHKGVTYIMHDAEYLPQNIAEDWVVFERQLLIRCADGCLRVRKIQKPGGKVLAAEDFLRGYR